MPNEWKVILRAGEKLDLTAEQQSRYTQIVTSIYADKVAQAPPLDETEMYHQFLNEHVFSDPSLVEFLESIEVSNENISKFQNGHIDINSLMRTWHQIQFSLDELIDFVMMLKIVRDYSEMSPTGRIESRFRLQKLLYLVNKEISLEESFHMTSKYEDELGWLDRTGYRYRFTKRSAGPYSEDVYEDKNRLFAWCLLDEPIVGEQGTGEVAEKNRQYGLELSAQGEVLLEQFYNEIESSESMMVETWNLAQKSVVQETSKMGQEEFMNHIESMTSGDVEIGEQLLSGPIKKFKKNDIKFLDQLAEQMAHISTTEQPNAGVGTLHV